MPRCAVAMPGRVAAAVRTRGDCRLGIAGVLVPVVMRRRRHDRQQIRCQRARGHESSHQLRHIPTCSIDRKDIRFILNSLLALSKEQPGFEGRIVAENLASRRVPGASARPGGDNRSARQIDRCTGFARAQVLCTSEKTHLFAIGRSDYNQTLLRGGAKGIDRHEVCDLWLPRVVVRMFQSLSYAIADVCKSKSGGGETFIQRA